MFIWIPEEIRMFLTPQRLGWSVDHFQLQDQGCNRVEKKWTEHEKEKEQRGSARDGEKPRRKVLLHAVKLQISLHGRNADAT